MLTLSQKLQLKPGTSLRLVGAPDDIRAVLTSEGVTVTDQGSALLIFCESPADVERAAQIAHTDDSLLWLAYRKGPAAKASGLNRDVGWQPMRAKGLRPVRSIAFDDVWSGLRYRPVEAVKSRT